MNCVDRDDAVAYCGWRRRDNRLPSKAELLWAARGGEEARPFPWGTERPGTGRLNACGTECVDEVNRRGWEHEVGPMYREDDAWPLTAPRGAHPDGASRDGSYDLVGNVEEWTSDAFGSYFAKMGGSWGSSLLVELDDRLHGLGPASARNSLTGFRCARSG